jgi:cytidyltransferase-like protein
MLHSGHVQFFREAAAFGEVYVALGSDQTVFELKGRTPVNDEHERQFMVQSVEYVKEAFIARGSGMLDFEAELRGLQPDIFVVNEDGNLAEKQELCEELGIEYLVLSRQPHEGLAPRSTTELRGTHQLPYRIDIAGGWLDQPWVSEHHPGSVITLSIEPTIEFNERSGMASSTRRTAIDLWGPKFPPGEYEKTAKILFCCDNPPGTTEVSGSQDSIGLVFPGLAKSWYNGEYWPAEITRVTDERSLQFVEDALYLVTLGPRHESFSVLKDTRIDREGARRLALATDQCWKAILERDIQRFGRAFRASFEAQVTMFPNMLTKRVLELIDQYRERALGWKLSGAGGGGYLILVSEKAIPHAVRIAARRGIE